MPITEDLDVYLADFGVSCTAGATTANGILDMPGEVVAGGMVLTTDYSLTTRYSNFGTLNAGDAITVDGDAYTVRENRRIGDGKFIEIALQKT